MVNQDPCAIIWPLQSIGYVNRNFKGNNQPLFKVVIYARAMYCPFNRLATHRNNPPWKKSKFMTLASILKYYSKVLDKKTLLKKELHKIFLKIQTQILNKDCFLYCVKEDTYDFGLGRCQNAKGLRTDLLMDIAYHWSKNAIRVKFFFTKILMVAFVHIQYSTYQFIFQILMESFSLFRKKVLGSFTLKSRWKMDILYSCKYYQFGTVFLC